MYHEKFTPAELEAKSADIMQSFDFERVLNHMKETDWKWYQDGEMKVPDLEAIRSQARSLLNHAIWTQTPTTNCGTGGFMVYKMPWGLSLTFQLCSSSN
jgi:hypothetical protein